MVVAMYDDIVIAYNYIKTAI